MALIEWGPEYEMGIPSIDEEHKEFFSYINDLQMSMMSGCSVKDMHDVLERITEYTKRHFRHEEELMRECSYPERAAHAAEHEQFLLIIKDFQRRLSIDPVGLSVDLFNTLKDWVNKHMMHMDVAFARHYLDRLGRTKQKRL